MSATSSAFGLRPAYHPSGSCRAVAHRIASGYATAIYENDPVKLISTGYVNLGATTGALTGSFSGVEYTLAGGRPQYSNFWPAGTVTLGAADAKAWITTDPNIVYEIQSNGTVAIANISEQANVSSAIGTTVGNAGFSLATLDIATLSTGAPAQLRILDVAPYPDNAFGDAFVIVRVQIATHSYVATVNAF